MIADYLAALRGSLRWRSDVDDLISEVDDHLRTAAGRLEATGLEPLVAQRHVIARFGDTTVIARAFASSEGIAMPTQLTRTAGTFALVGAITWLVAAVTTLLRARDISEDDWEAAYLTVTVLAFAAAVCTTVAVYGLLRRAGAGRGWVPGVAMLFAILGTLMLGVAVWAWIIAVPLLAIAALIAVLRLRSSGLGSAPAEWLLVAAWPIGVGLALLLSALDVGPVDSYGDHAVAYLVGFATGCVLFAAGLAANGRWLRSEQSVDAPESRVAT